MRNVTDPRKIKPENVVRRRSFRSLAKAWVASALCVIPGLYCAGVVAFALRNAEDYATALPQFVRYVLAPGLLAILFAWAAIRGSRVLRVNLGAAATAVLVLLFANEARLEARYLSAVSDLFAAGTTDSSGRAVPVHGLPPARTVKGLNQKLATVRMEDAVVGGIPFSHVDLCASGGRAITYRADRYGFRNPETVYSGPIDLAVIGDSFVEGICLPEGSDLMGRIRTRNAQAVGLGVRGAGPLMYLAMLGRYGPILRPNWTVIAFYEGNDWEDLERELRVGWLRQGLDGAASFGPADLSPEHAKSAEAQARQWASEPPPTSRDLIQKTHTLRNFLALHQTWTQLGLGYPKVARRIPEFEQALARARTLVAGWNGRLALAYIPQTSRFVGIFPDKFTYDQLRSRVAAAANTQGIPFIDLTPAIARQAQPMALYGEGHFNAEGARLSADTIMSVLDELRKPGGDAR